MAMIELLLSHGAKVNDSTPNGLTPLFIAAKNNYPEIADYLLEKGANAYVRCQTSTPIEVALKAKHNDIIDVFLEHNVTGIVPGFLMSSENRKICEHKIALLIKKDIISLEEVIGLPKKYLIMLFLNDFAINGLKNQFFKITDLLLPNMKKDIAQAILSQEGIMAFHNGLRIEDLKGLSLDEVNVLLSPQGIELLANKVLPSDILKELNPDNENPGCHIMQLSQPMQE